MPGAWPSELNDDPVDTQWPTFSMAFPVRFGANICNTITYLRDSSYSLCNTLGSIFPLRRQSSGTASPNPEDGERARKRRRVDDEGSPDIPEIEQQPTPISLVDDPMDIDTPSPSPINLEDYRTETSSEGPMGSGRRFTDLESSPSVSPIISPNSSAAIVAARAARRATLLSTGKKFSPKRSSTQTKTPPPERQEQTEHTVQAQQEEHKQEEPSSKHQWGPLPPPKYKNILEFFEHDDEICLPGLEHLRLTPKTTKIYELDSQRERRLRIEREKAEKERQERLRIEEERFNEALRPLGLRRPKGALISSLTPDWEQKARASPMDGRTEQHKWQGARHRDGVELSPHDFGRLVPENEWLNDNDIQAALVHLATYVNDKAGVRPKVDPPKCVALSSQYWSNFRAEPRKNVYPRGLDRNWGMKPANFLDIDTVLIPVNQANHWTVLIIRPTRRTVAYVDSFHSAGLQHISDAQTWLATFLGDKYVANEWRTEQYSVPHQTNGYDCGMFVITNSIYLSLGIDPSGYSQDDMPLQRLRIAAVLLNGGFTGPFDLSHL
ncbi:cysteine proteinase [Rostrohypoxylon terebratum]|nr:cysteine proteinase [Rostrohypoxylon terebratum]